ncbi:AAA family ATPase [Psychrobacillus psychrodurans]|uniref:Nuclease SbcCD subunit C n=1 Tax=Psychrobacillus psychrodurans TaxID=126157 RepID=A0A9X3LDX2_9BACI|nr:SMC family ATPase [Psychrobacillus psychrodurans]MCZ8535071.1 SMC family ATPase [Psychrobacillus psychrodurans]
MKPIQLKMSAFGPYKLTETIDFTELNENQLFVISGATGAGKTTIFDGICFALYGAGSGEDRRDTKMMRSDFATDDTHTSVELIFEIHNRRYRILRQLPHVKKGNKSATGERYEFFEVQATREIPAVERQIVSEINKKVEETIGLTLDQFSQIVMLPQGEFRKLLTSTTENKEAILRKIFKTEPYKMIHEKLKEKKVVAEAKLKTEQLTQENFTEKIIASFPNRESNLFQIIEEDNFNIFQLVEALKEETNFYKKKITLDERKCEEAYEKHINKQKSYHESKMVNDRFNELEAKEQQLADLEARKEEFIQKQQQLDSADLASNIEPVESYFNELELDVKGKQNLFEKSKIEKVAAEDKLQQVEAVFIKESKNKEIREKSIETVIHLSGLLPIFEDLEIKKTELLSLEKINEQLEQQLEIITASLQGQKESSKQQKHQIEMLEERVESLDNKGQQLALLQTQHSKLQEYKVVDQQLNMLITEEIKQRNKFEQCKETYDVIEQKWIGSQASILASKLVMGEPCPVCGSKNHIDSHVATGERKVEESELRLAKATLNKEESTLLTYKAKKETAEAQIQKVLVQLEEYEVDAGLVEQVETDLLDMQREVQQLRLEKETLSSLKQSYKDALAKVEKLEHEKLEVDTLYREKCSQAKQAKAVYASKLDTIPSHIPTLQHLKIEITQAKKQKDLFEQAWEEAQNKMKIAQEVNTKAQLVLEHSKVSLQEIELKREKAQEQFHKALNKASFETVEAYMSAKLPESDRSFLKIQCNEYKQQLHTVTEQVREGKVQLENKTKVDLGPLEEELRQLKEVYEQALAECNSTREYEKAGREIEEKITSTSERITLLEEQVHRIMDLYDILRGHNQLKISFERYVQIEYLEQIVQAANERLKHMSSGQFQLLRSDRQETHGKQSGLGLDVYDAYTGQKRDVKTLSGGEKFNASLCLALGMADVIQSFQGNIRIETMFIDEGFGSLDEESLNKAIDTLIDLQKSGRMIGVISHVAELKAAIPAILEVEKQKEGYSRTKFVFK